MYCASGSVWKGGPMNTCARAAALKRGQGWILMEHKGLPKCCPVCY